MRALRPSSCPMRTPGLMAAALMVLAMGGCSGSKSKAVPAAGQVFFEGKPLANAQVVLIPVGDKAQPEAAHPVGITDEQGRFQLTSFKERDGAPAGEYTVLVQWYPQIKRPHNEIETGPNALPARYSDPKQSPLRVTVAKGNAELKPLEVSRN